MMSWLRRFAARLGGTDELPDDFAGSLSHDEQVLAVAHTQDGPLVATHLGLWLPEGRRVGWHLVSKATWERDVLTVVEAEQAGTAGVAVLLRDLPAKRFVLTAQSRLPDVVHARVTGSIKTSHHRAVGTGGAWFVQRKVPGQDGIVLQVRADAGTDEGSVAGFAQELSARLDELRND